MQRDWPELLHQLLFRDGITIADCVLRMKWRESLIGVYNLGAETGRLKRSRLSSTPQPHDFCRDKICSCLMTESIRSLPPKEI